MVGFAVVGLIAVLLLVFLVLSAKTWNWAHIVMMFFVFIAAVVWAVGASGVFAKRHAWMQIVQKHKDTYELEKERYREVVYGKGQSAGYSDDSLFGSELNLKLAMLGQGRKWPSGVVRVSGNGYQLTFPTAAAPAGDGSDDPSASVNVANIKQDMVLFAFLEETVRGLGKVPVAFQGGFVVTSVNANVIQLEPVQRLQHVPITPNADNDDGSHSWSLYEKMPLDGRNVFKNTLAKKPEDLDHESYRAALINEIIPQSEFFPQLSEEEYNALIDRYVFDGMDVGAIDRINNQFATTADDRDVMLKFNNQSKPFVVDAPGDYKESGRIDAQGRAVDPILKNGKGADGKDFIELVKGRELLVDEVSGILGYEGAETPTRSIEEENDVESLRKYYRRPLTDHFLSLSKYADMIEDLRHARDRSTVEAEQALSTLQLAQKQQAERTATRTSVEADNDQFKLELDSITKLVQQRHSELQERYNTFSRIYKAIGVMNAELSQIANSLKNEIDLKTKQASK